MHALIMLPGEKLVIVERVNMDAYTWVDPGAAGLQLGLMITRGRNRWGEVLTPATAGVR